MQLLDSIIKEGDVPVIQSCQLNANSSYQISPPHDSNHSSSSSSSAQLNSSSRSASTAATPLLPLPASAPQPSLPPTSSQPAEAAAPPAALPRGWTSNFLRLLHWRNGANGEATTARTRKGRSSRQQAQQQSSPVGSTGVPGSPAVPAAAPAAAVSSAPSWRVAEPPAVRLRSVTLCLFPAEDRHRMSLRYSCSTTLSRHSQTRTGKAEQSRIAK